MSRNFLQNCVTQFDSPESVGGKQIVVSSGKSIFNSIGKIKIESIKGLFSYILKVSKQIVSKIEKYLHNSKTK